MVKNPPANAGDTGSSPGPGRSHIKKIKKKNIATKNILVYNIVYLWAFCFVLFCLFLAALGLRCCAQTFSSCSKRGPLFVAVCGLLIAVAARCRA